MTRPSRPPLLTTRTAVVLLLGFAAGATAGVLTYLAGHDMATAVLGGFAAFGGGVAFFHTNLGENS